ncbi:MAG: hypothetical protein M1361_01885 [Patescibacteria group bacterium]|nr:hypothetical protein [Patescibacteria group bacterium]MCL5224336.1 hypothetical protein [Patescibacteria group bacterium]
MIILISGPINTGKSTVAKILAQKLPNAALLEVDALREMVGWMPIDLAVPLNLENAVSLIRNFSLRGLEVIVPYPLSRNNYDYIMSNIGDLGAAVYTFTLAPKLSEALKNRGGRELREDERKRVEYHYKIGLNKPDFGEVIDNSRQSPEETARTILNKIGR